MVEDGRREGEVKTEAIRSESLAYKCCQSLAVDQVIAIVGNLRSIVEAYGQVLARGYPATRLSGLLILRGLLLYQASQAYPQLVTCSGALVGFLERLPLNDFSSTCPRHIR